MLVAAAALPAAAALDDPPSGLIPTSTTLAKVRALYARTHARDASSRAAATTIEEWRLTQDRLTGTYRVYILGRDERDVTSIGPFIFESGIHAGVHWQQTRNGITFTDAGFHEARDAVSERAWESDTDARDVRLIGESVALNAYVVEIDPAGGRREWRFVDKKSGNVVRLEEIAKDRRITTIYDDFRTFDGIPQPSRVRTIDSFGNERDQQLLSRTLDLTPDPRVVDIVPTRRTLVEFPPFLPLVHLPVRFVSGLAVVRVRIGLRSYDFLLDSGAAGIVLDPSVVDDQKLDTYGTHIGATVGTFNESSTIVPLLGVGPLKLRNVVARVVGVPFHLDDRTRIAGLLGFDFFADCVVHLDFEHGVADAIAPAAFKPPPDVVPLALALDDRTPTVRARADGAVGRMVLDTGANRSILTTGFADRADVMTDAAASIMRFRGVGGVGVGEAVNVKTFDLGGFSVPDVVVDVSSADLGIEDVDATIGTDVSAAFDLYFDYRSATVYVRRAHRAVGVAAPGSQRSIIAIVPGS
jgi:hypothetical protein